MKILYLVRCGKRVPVWVATDRTNHVVGLASHSRLRVLTDWVHRHGWPEVTVWVKGVHPGVRNGLASACDAGLLALCQVVDLAEETPGKLALPGRYWEVEETKCRSVSVSVAAEGASSPSARAVGPTLPVPSAVATVVPITADGATDAPS